MPSVLKLPFEQSLQERFEAFDAANPHVFSALVTLARSWKAAGRTRCGIAMLCETLRYQHGLKTTGDEYKINNDFRSRYVRKMIETYPDEFSGFFQLRELHAA